MQRQELPCMGEINEPSVEKTKMTILQHIEKKSRLFCNVHNLIFWRFEKWTTQ